VAFLILIGPVMVLALWRPKYAVAPWMGNTLSYQGVMGGAELAGHRPIVLPKPLRIFIAVAVFSMASILLADLLLWLTRPFTVIRRARQFFLFPDRSDALLPAMVLFAAAYFTLLLPRCASNMAYDRYILPLMPCVLFPLLLSYQQQGKWKVPKTVWILLGIYAAFAICITQEITALDRTRAQAANVLIAAGVPRTEIDAGFEFDFETQIMTTGYVNDPRIKIPSDAVKKDLISTYSVAARYRLEFAPAVDTQETEHGWIGYTTYLYPFHRRVYIDKFRDPWWLYPSRAATHPADRNHRFVLVPDAATDDDNNK
jgi:hypothetical protein